MPPLPLLDDEEGERVAPGVRVIDAHVHLFPEPLFAALWRWFDEHAWPVRYRLHSDAVVDFLTSRGVERVVGLLFAHEPAMAEGLNAYMSALARRRPEVIGLGTVFPGEEGARAIVRRAFEEHGLSGIKLHCHVQCVAADDPRLDPVFEEAAGAGRPVVIHTGSAPHLEGYACDPRAVCPPDAVERALARHPDLTLVVPHLGAYESDAYERLLDRYPGLYLDTTMAVGGYLPGTALLDLVARRAERILYGTDFPNLPYAWDRELRRLLALELEPARRDALLWGNAARLFQSK